MKKERKIDAQKSAKKVVKSSSQEIENHVTKKRERGITLIALVVTIIIMLILAAVTLNMALGDNGLIQMAKFAASKYEEAADNESKAMQGLANGINNPGSSTQTPPMPEEEKTDRSQLQIGDIVNYTPDIKTEGYQLEDKYSGYDSKDIEDGDMNDNKQTIKQETYTWKIMNIGNDGTVDIMGVPKSDMTKVYFRGATGYNNGVYLLNKICETLYGNTKLEATARSINIDDIVGHFNAEVGQKAINDYTINGVTYGNTKTYSGEDAYYPKLAKFEDHVNVDNSGFKDLKESEDGTSLPGQEISIPLPEHDLNPLGDHTDSKKCADSCLEVKMTCYEITPDAAYFNADGEAYRKLYFPTDTSYWLASRAAQTDNMADFGLRAVHRALSAPTLT